MCNTIFCEVPLLKQIGFETFAISNYLVLVFELNWTVTHISKKTMSKLEHAIKNHFLHKLLEKDCLNYFQESSGRAK